MQLNALWTIEFATNHGDFGTGVAVLVDGHIYGGDTNYCYEGTYQCRGEEVVARVKLCLHSGKAASDEIPEDPFVVRMRGGPVGDELELTGVLEHEPNTKLFIHLQRHSGVPAPGDEDLPERHEVDELPARGMVAGTESGYLIDESAERLPLY